MSEENTEAQEAAQEVEIPKSVKVGNREVVLTLPKSMSVRYDVAAYYNTNSTRALAAALGLCWGSIGRPKAKYEDSYSVGAYGGQVFDELLSKGVSAQEIALAGSWAYVMIARSLPQAQEVDKAEGN